MSERILDFEKADAEAMKSSLRGSEYDAAFEVALEAQAQVRLTALESEWDKTHDEEVALLGRLVVEYRTRAEAAEAELRMTWWMNHGCRPSAQYGDDGEMSCGCCAIDFKRMPLDEIRERMQNASVERLKASGVTVESATLRAAHQQLKDAVVEEAVEWQRWQRRYAANLAAFGAHHPEVTR